MSLSITHAKVSAIPDVGDASLVEPSDWNATHTVSYAFTTTLGDVAWRVPQAIYVNGTDASPYGAQAMFQYDNSGVMRSVLYSDGTQYWGLYGSGTHVGDIGYITAGGLPGVAIFGSSTTGRASITYDQTVAALHFGTKLGSGSANNQVTLLPSGIVNVQSGGMFAFSSNATNSGVAADTALARNAAGTVEINNGTAGTYRDLIARAIATTGAITIDALTGSANAVINLIGRNSGTGATAQVYADQNGALQFVSVNGQVTLNSTATGATQFLLNNTSTGGKSFALESSGSASAFGAGNFFLQEQSAFTIPFRYSGTTANQWIFNSTEPVCWGNDNFTSSPDTGLSRSAAGVIAVGNATQGDVTGTIIAKIVQTGTTTVASLPAAGTKGRRSFVTDATATTFASIVAGTGANNVPVYDDGTNWRIG